MVLNNFNLLEVSIWPIFCSMILIYMLFNIVIGIDYDCFGLYSSVITLLIVLVYAMLEWVLDISIESNMIGRHNKIFRRSLYLGFILYILSEAFIFFSLFLGYITTIISPSIFQYGEYMGSIIGYSKLGLSLMNLLILLCGGLLLSAASNENRYIYIIVYLLLGLILCIVFSYIQRYEYITSNVNITDGVYGTYFYSLSGLHGIHMLIGEFIILVTIGKVYMKHSIANKRLSIHISSINLHFLDICLLFIYGLVY